MDTSDVHFVSQGPESACEVLERKETKERLLALLQSIANARLSPAIDLPQDPILQLVHLAHIGLAQVSQNPSAVGSPSQMSMCSSRSDTSGYAHDVKPLRRDVLTQKRALNSYQHMCAQPELAEVVTCEVEKLRVWKCNYCQKRFVSEDFLELHVVRRHPEFAGSGTERHEHREVGLYTLPSAFSQTNTDCAHLQLAFSIQYEVLENSILRTNSQKAKLQRTLEVLDPSSSASMETMQQAIKLQQDLNQLLEQQKQLLTTQAERIKEMQTGVRSKESSDPVSCARKLAKIDSFHSSFTDKDSLGEISQCYTSLPDEKPHSIGKRVRRKKEQNMKKSSNEEQWSFESDGKMPSLLRCPSIPKEPLDSRLQSASNTSRRARYKPSTRYNQLELSLSELREDGIRQLIEKANELRKRTQDCVALQEKYGQGLHSCYPHNNDQIYTMRGQIEREIKVLTSKQDVGQFRSTLTEKLKQTAYIQIRSDSVTQVKQLITYLLPAPDLPRSSATASQKCTKVPPSLALLMQLEDSLHANQVPEPRQIQILSPMKSSSPQEFPALLSMDAFNEGKVILKSDLKLVNPNANRVPHKGRSMRESLISLDMDNSASFSIRWEDEDDDEYNEWRTVSIEDAKRLGFYPVTNPSS